MSNLPGPQGPPAGHGTGSRDPHGPVAHTLSVHAGLEDIDPRQWDALATGGDPFLSHAFLHALETTGCLGEEQGWLPRHLVLRDGAGRIAGAMPLYLKLDSWGEFVFDWAWADAYERAGLPYYPKGVCAIPYNPVTGARLLVHPGADAALVSGRLVDGAIDLARRERLSGMHWLFPTPDQVPHLRASGQFLRLGLQYHWYNADYDCFGDFLDALTARRRKQVRRERRRVTEQGISVSVMHGDEADARVWDQVHAFYVSIFERKYGRPVLTREFFHRIGQTLGDRIVLVFAHRSGETVACAVNLRSDAALFGRFWGSRGQYHSLHFEVCYYQGIEYCIRHRLQRFEPGAQGEHKIPRGFLPTATWSAHWIAHEGFRDALARFCDQERALMLEEYRDLIALSPYRAPGPRTMHPGQGP